MNFGASGNFIWLWLLPLAALALFWGRQRRMRRLLAYVGQTRSGSGRLLFGRNLTKMGLMLLALVFVIIALARPRWGFEWTEVRRQGVDIAVAIDVSRSMLATDYPPSRLERARRSVIDLLEVADGDRLALVAFAGVAFIQCPLTVDYHAVRMFLDYIDTDLIPNQGTNIADAINVATQALTDGGAAADSAGRALILITDGEDFSADAIKAAQKAAAVGIKIFPIGLGDPAGAPVPDLGGGLKKDHQGNVVISRLNEAFLTELASLSGGKYLRAQVGGHEIEAIYKSDIRGVLQEREFEATREKLWFERFQWFVLAAFLCLFFEFIIIDWIAVAVLFMLVEGLSSRPSFAGTVNAAEESYRKSDFEQAAKGFLDAEIDQPTELKHSYNRAVSQYRAGNFQAAKEGFEKSAQSSDRDLAARSTYNLGNTEAALENWDGAAKAFRKALDLSPNDKQAKDNLAWVEERQKQQKDKKQEDQNKKEQTNPDKQDKQDKKQDQDQKQGDDSPQSSPQPDQNKKNDPSNKGEQKPPEEKGSSETKPQESQAPSTGKPGERPSSGEEQSESKKGEGDAAKNEKNESPASSPVPGAAGEEEQEGREAGLSRQEAEQLLRSVQDNPRKYRYRPAGAGEAADADQGKDW